MNSDIIRPRTAFFSVSDKTGVAELAKNLNHDYGIEIMATGGTQRKLENYGLKVTPITEVTKNPKDNYFDGRMKSLSFQLESGIMYDRGIPQHVEEADEMGLKPIDMVICNFYPLERAIADGLEHDGIIKNMDIGGPTMVDAAQKNSKHVAVITDPDDYQAVLTEMSENGGGITSRTREVLATKATFEVARYQMAKSNWRHMQMSENGIPRNFCIALQHHQDVLYGENPGTDAMLYSIYGTTGGLKDWKQLHGKLPSFNNINDAGKCNLLLKGFEEHPTVVVAKHGTIAGFAYAESIEEAYALADACNPEAAFGGVISMNRECSTKIAETIRDSAIREVVIAPSYEENAIEEIIKNRGKSAKTEERKQMHQQKLRIFQSRGFSDFPFDIRIVDGGATLQRQPDHATFREQLDKSLEFPTGEPENGVVAKLKALYEVAYRVPSNAVVCGDGRSNERGEVEALWTYGIGSSTKRNEAAWMAINNADNREMLKDFGLEERDRSKGSLIASDGFFPKEKDIKKLRGVRCIIANKGSVRDRYVIEECKKYGIGLVHTSVRAFSH